MNHHRTTREPLSGKLISIAAAVVMALVLGAAHSLDGPEDYSADWAQSEALQELQASEAGTARREAAAQALCNEARGPNSQARWLPDGSLVCSTRQGCGAMSDAHQYLADAVARQEAEREHFGKVLSKKFCTDQRQPCPSPYLCGLGCNFNDAELPQCAALDQRNSDKSSPHSTEVWELTPLGWAVLAGLIFWVAFSAYYFFLKP